MTLPSSITFPSPTQYIQEDGEGLQAYLQELTHSLEGMYGDLAANVNGGWKTDKSGQQKTYTPTVFGTSAAGSGTYAADRQIGWSLRQGLLADVWFDVTWTAHTGAGNLYVALPYLVAQSSQKPFAGVIQTGSIAFGGYLVCNAIPNTRRCEIWGCTSGGATANIAIPASGQLIGHIRYVGQREERS